VEGHTVRGHIARDGDSHRIGDAPEDVEGHSLSGRVFPSEQEADDVQGHSTNGRFAPAEHSEDVEGHSAKCFTPADDVEGHTLRGHIATGGDSLPTSTVLDDVEGHGIKFGTPGEDPQPEASDQPNFRV
jgi:hypothetical protein